MIVKRFVARELCASSSHRRARPARQLRRRPCKGIILDLTATTVIQALNSKTDINFEEASIPGGDSVKPWRMKGGLLFS